MKLSKLKTILPTLNNVAFQLENGNFVPEHFHVTEVGEITKKFLDCGGVIRTERVINFQLWNANGFEHRLKPTKLLNIINLSEEKLAIGDFDIEVEYQNEIADSQTPNQSIKNNLQTIGKFDLDFNGNHFVLKNKTTACLAEDTCGIPTEKQKKNLSELTTCSPNSGCC